MKIPDEESNCGTVLLPAVGSHNQQEHGSKPANISLPSKRRLRNAQYRPSPVESSSRSQGNFRTCYVMPLDNASLILKGQSQSPDLRIYGGDKGDRTPDLMTASHALSQLSYIPVRWCVSNYSRAKFRVKQSSKIFCDRLT